MWDYTDEVKEHFLNPRNVGEVDDPDGVGEEYHIRSFFYRIYGS